MKKFVLLFCFSVLSVACGLGPDLSKDRVQRSPSPTPFVPDKSVTEYLRLGDEAYSAGDHAAAITPYKRALEIEQREQKLEKKQFYNLVSNLAISYARAGDTRNARVTIAHGLSKQYDYPIFHYALACSYGVEGDESSALHHLENAYKFKNKIGPGEKFPDPLADDAFASISDNSTFKDAVARMKRTKPGV